jgi:hypothetical protein
LIKTDGKATKVPAAERVATFSSFRMQKGSVCAETAGSLFSFGETEQSCTGSDTVFHLNDQKLTNNGTDITLTYSWRMDSVVLTSGSFSSSELLSYNSAPKFDLVKRDNQIQLVHASNDLMCLDDRFEFRNCQIDTGLHIVQA